jgi:hypothetical protein
MYYVVLSLLGDVYRRDPGCPISSQRLCMHLQLNPPNHRLDHCQPLRTIPPASLACRHQQPSDVGGAQYPSWGCVLGSSARTPWSSSPSFILSALLPCNSLLGRRIKSLAWYVVRLSVRYRHVELLERIIYAFCSSSRTDV